MNIVRPDGWGAAVDYESWTPDPTPKERVALHYNGPALARYTAGPRRESEILRAIERFHMAHPRNWRGSAYSHAIGASGTVYTIRENARLGAHAGDYDGDGVIENRETYAVLLILGEGQPMTPAMQTSIVALRRALQSDAGRELPLIGHREIAEHGSGTVTACPGSHVMSYVTANRRLDPPSMGLDIAGGALTTVGQALAWARARDAEPGFLNVIPLYFEMAPAYTIRPGIGVAQSAWETGFGRFGRAVTPAHHNWCGLKVTEPTGADDDPNSHARFPSNRHGVMAHLEHLRLYAAGVVPNAIDPRHFPWLAGSAPTVESLGGKWAPSPDYGVRLRDLFEEIRSTDTPAPPETLEPWARESWEWATRLGVITESSEPDAVVTDERFAVFLERYDRRDR